MRLSICHRWVWACRRSMSTVTGASPQVTSPLNFVNGQRVNPNDTSAKQENFAVLNPATGIYIVSCFLNFFNVCVSIFKKNNSFSTFGSLILLLVIKIFKHTRFCLKI